MICGLALLRHDLGLRIKSGAATRKSDRFRVAIAPPDPAKPHQHWKPHRKAEKVLAVTQPLRIFAFTLGRLHLWIAALMLVGLLHDPQGALQIRVAQQISAQPAGVLASAPKFALTKPATPETCARLIPLLDAAQIPPAVLPAGFRLLRRTPPMSAPRQSPGHSWQARAPPVLASRLI